MKDIDERLVNDFERARRSVGKIYGLKGVPAEIEYSRLYDKLAMRGIGNRRRLRKKYRSN